MIDVNSESLMRSYGSNPVVKAICDHFAGRINNQTETMLHRMQHHLELVCMARGGARWNRADAWSGEGRAIMREAASAA